MLEEAGDTLRGAWCRGQWLATPRCGFCFAHPWPLILQTPPPSYFFVFCLFLYVWPALIKTGRTTVKSASSGTRPRFPHLEHRAGGADGGWCAHACATAGHLLIRNMCASLWGQSARPQLS